MPASQQAFLKTLRLSAVTTVVLIVLAGGIGFVVAGQEGLVGGAIGAALAGLFLGLTIASIAFANRFVQSDLFVVLFFGIVLGAWLVKFVVFIAMIFLLRDQPWLDEKVLLISLIVGMVVSLVVDVRTILRARIPVVSLPE